MVRKRFVQMILRLPTKSWKKLLHMTEIIFISTGSESKLYYLINISVTAALYNGDNLLQIKQRKQHLEWSKICSILKHCPPKNLGHETMVCAVCLSIFFCYIWFRQVSAHYHHSRGIHWKIAVREMAWTIKCFIILYDVLYGLMKQS